MKDIFSSNGSLLKYFANYCCVLQPWNILLFRQDWWWRGRVLGWQPFCGAECSSEWLLTLQSSVTQEWSALTPDLGPQHIVCILRPETLPCSPITLSSDTLVTLTFIIILAIIWTLLSHHISGIITDNLCWILTSSASVSALVSWLHWTGSCLVWAPAALPQHTGSQCSGQWTENTALRPSVQTLHYQLHWHVWPLTQHSSPSHSLENGKISRLTSTSQVDNNYSNI